MHFRLKHIIPVFMAIAAMLTIGCSRPDEKEEGKLIKVPLRISVASPDEQTLQPGSKAGSQMDPENLNPIKSLAVFQYDGEGNLRNEIYRDETGSYDENLFYHDYTQGGTSPGELSVTLDLALRTGSTTICLIANMSKEECDSIRRNCRYRFSAHLVYAGSGAYRHIRRCSVRSCRGRSDRTFHRIFHIRFI